MRDLLALLVEYIVPSIQVVGVAVVISGVVERTARVVYNAFAHTLETAGDR